MNEPSLGIVIVSWYCREDVLACLASLRSQDLPLQTIVVDNAPGDGTAQEVAAGFPEVEIVSPGRNIGFAGGCNRGAQRVRAPWLLLLNPDTVVPPGALKRWLEQVLARPGIGASGPQLRNCDGSLQPSVRRFPTLVTNLVLLLKLHRLFPAAIAAYLCKGFDYTRDAEVDQVMGAALLTPTEVYRRLGGFNERSHVWFEEVDYCRRLRNMSLRVLYVADVAITHAGGISFNQRRSLWRQWHFSRSMLGYTRQHLGLSSAIFVAFCIPLGLAVAFLSSLLPRRLTSHARREWYNTP